MPAQFIHYEDYAQKAGSYRKTTGFIFGEVSRQASMSDHIESPRPPVIVYGASVEEAERLHNKKAREATIQVKGGRRRKIRTDQKTLASIVISHPYLLEDAEQNPKMMAELRSYEQNSINWLKDTFGNDLISVIRHNDEPHAHWHALILPLSDPEFKASKLHPGKVAKAKVMHDPSLEKLDSKLLNKKGDMAYQAAMRDFQDSFHEKVSKQAGLTRLGPKLRRLTRAEWHLEKKQARALKEVMTEAKAYETQEVTALREEIAQLKKVKTELEQALSESTVTITSVSEERATGEFNTTNSKPVLRFAPPDDKPKPPPFTRPAYLLPRRTDLQEQGGQQIVNSEWHKPSGAIVDTLKPTKLHNVPSKVEEDWYDEEEAKRQREEHERFLENKSFTFYDLCKSPEADIFLQERARAAADGAKNTQTKPVGDNRTQNVKELPKTNEAQVIDPRSLAKRFRETFGAQRYKPRISLDGPSFGLSSSSQSPKTQEHQQPDANPIQQPYVRYTRTIRPDNAKLGLPLGYDPLARFRRKPNQEPSPKPDQEAPDNAPRRPTT